MLDDASKATGVNIRIGIGEEEQLPCGESSQLVQCGVLANTLRHADKTEPRVVNRLEELVGPILGGVRCHQDLQLFGRVAPLQSLTNLPLNVFFFVAS